MLFEHRCPECFSNHIRFDYDYSTISNGVRKMFVCKDCDTCFSETTNTFLYGIRTPVSKIWQVINARTEGMAFNAACRVFEIAKNTLLSWERKFADLHQTLLLYSLSHQFLQLVIEGDEFYTKVGQNVAPELSSGWTVVLLDRASRFIWESTCGIKDRALFTQTIETLAQIIDQAQYLTLLTDGERRYGNILFEICHEVLRTGKPGRPRKTLKKGVTVRVKNKGSQSHKKGPKKPKYQTTCPTHPETEPHISDQQTHANHLEANNSAMRRKCSPYRRKTNTYAKSTKGLQRVLDMYWVIHNFVRAHFTTKQVPAVKLGVLSEGLSPKQLLSVQLV